MLGSPEYPADIRLKLTWAARRSNDVGSPLKLAPENLEEIASSVVEPRRPSRKLDLLLLHLGRNAVHVGSSVHVNLFMDWPVICARGEGEFADVEEMLVAEDAVGY